jgi:hypothetical protein
VSEGGGGGVAIVALGFHAKARAPPIIASTPPKVVVTPTSEKSPNSKIMIPHIRVERGFIYIIADPINMMIPKKRNAYNRKPKPKKNANKVPIMVHNTLPISIINPASSDIAKGVVGFSLI